MQSVVTLVQHLPPTTNNRQDWSFTGFTSEGTLPQDRRFCEGLTNGNLTQHPAANRSPPKLSQTPNPSGRGDPPSTLPLALLAHFPAPPPCQTVTPRKQRLHHTTSESGLM